jgi:murein DD-endopeptidase MepM/ murein hydrolase activator NlpD
MHDMIQRKTNLERILSYDESVLENMLQNENALKENLKKLNAQRLEKQTLAIELKNQIGIVSEEKIKRSTLLNEIHNQKSLQLAAIESLKKTANALDRTINSLKRGSNLTQPADTLSTKRFISLKGLLNMPVKGRIVSSFGPYNDAKFKVTNFRSGIDIKAERGEPVYAVCVGSVLFSSWFKGYGNMIILDHGDNYYTVYANVEETFKKKGDRVETGEVIATVGDTGSMIGPKLYFEVRHHGKPIDPKQWIKTG